MSYDAVVFDFFGTLSEAAKAVGWQATRLAEVLDVEADDMRAALRSSFRDRASGRWDVRDSLREVALRCGATPSDEQLAAAQAVRLEAQRTMTRCRPEAAPVLAELRRRGLRLGLISDCTHELPQLWPGLPVAPHIEVTVFSVLVGHCKPDPIMYATACEGLKADPAQCLYVGDGGSNELTGARRAGMTAVRLAAPDHDPNAVYRLEASWDGPVITSLNDVLKMV